MEGFKNKSHNVFVDTVIKSYFLYLIVRFNTVCTIIKFYNIFVATLKELLFIFDYATKYGLYKLVNLFVNLFIILNTDIAIWVSFYADIELVRINSLLIHFKFAN